MRNITIKILYFVLAFLAMVGCRPRGVLSNNEMRNLLYDLHRADGAIQVAGYNYGHNQEIASYYKSVLDKHGVTQAQFDSSLVWYTDNPQIFNKIYPRVVARLQADLEYEEVLRDERIRQYRTNKNKASQSSVEQPKLHIRPIEDVQKEYIYGIENPWKERKSQDFCEKNVIIFGKLEKK